MYTIAFPPYSFHKIIGQYIAMKKALNTKASLYTSSGGYLEYPPPDLNSKSIGYVSYLFTLFFARFQYRPQAFGRYHDIYLK